MRNTNTTERQIAHQLHVCTCHELTFGNYNFSCEKQNKTKKKHQLQRGEFVTSPDTYVDVQAQSPRNSMAIKHMRKQCVPGVLPLLRAWELWYSGKLSREKTFANFAVLWIFVKVFSAKFGDVVSFGAAQARRKFSRENRTNSRKFSAIGCVVYVGLCY